MDYATISWCLGGSIFPEEYRGRLDEIRSQCAESSSRASSTNDTPSATLLQAVSCIYTGSLSEAQRLLDSLLVEYDSNPQFIARCHVYAFLIETVKRLPPVLRFCSTLGNPAIRLLDAERNIEGKMATLCDISHRLSHSAMETVEYVLVGNLMTFNTTLHKLFRRHPRHPRTFARGEAVSLNTFADSLRGLAASAGLGITELYLQRLTVEMHLARGSDEWKGLLGKLRHSYEAAMDLNGMASCDLIEADGIISLPFTSPLAMNLITLTRADGWSDTTWDATQAEFPLQKNEDAEKLYDGAFFLFDAAASPRGKGAILLRRGCVHHAVAISAETNETNAKATTDALKQAVSHFADAARYFEGDIVNSMLVACHRLLLAISARHLQNTSSNQSLGLDHGLPSNVLLAAADLGRHARETGNPGTAQFMGSLMLRFGRWRFMSSQRDVQTALVCCQCARAFFEAAEEPYLQLQSLIAHASLLYESGDHERAQIAIENGRETQGLLERALESIQKASSSEPPERGDTGIRALRFDTVRAFDTVACRIYQTTGNNVLFEGWRRQRDQLAQSGSYEEDMKDITHRIEMSPPNSTPVFPVRNIVPETLSIEALESEYNKKMALVYEALDNADIEAWERHLRHFLSTCDTTAVTSPDSSPDMTAFYKLLALSQLGALDDARAILPVALGEYLTSSESPGWFNRVFEALAPPKVVVDRSKQQLHKADNALASCVLAQSWEVGARVLSKAESLCPGQFEKPQTIPPVPSSWITLTFVGTICEHNKQLQKALEWYLEALDRLEGLRKAVDIEVRRGCHSSIFSGELFAGLARVCISMHRSGGLEKKKGPSDFGLSGCSWLEQALLFIERGKARTLLDYVVTKDNGDSKKIQEWAQLAYEGRLLIGLEAEQGQREKALSPDEVARKLGQRPDEMKSREDVQRALSHLDAKQLALGAILGLAEPELDAIPLFSCIPRDTIVFEISSSRQGLIVLACTHQGIVGEYQSTLTDIQLRTLVLNFSRIVRSESTNAESAERLDEIASAISAELLEPLKHTMSDKDVVVFAPSHIMQLFPCTALILEKQPLFLSKIVYHIPSLSLLSHLSRRERLDLSPGQKTISVLASSKAAGSEMKPGRELVKLAIPMIGPEAVMIADAFATDAADLASCTTDELRSILRESNIVYLTTHGESMGSSPWQAFLDTEPPFRVLDLAALATTHARLIVFGCCWTGAGSANVGNDVVGFAHATLASGAGAYLGGLWRVHELVSLVLMVYFFRELAADGSIHLASALRNAQIAMYHMDNSSVVALIDETLKLWRQKINREDTKFLQRFKYSESYLVTLRKRFSREAEELNFKHPKMWAPFILTGWGGADPADQDPAPSASLRVGTHNILNEIAATENETAATDSLISEVGWLKWLIVTIQRLRRPRLQPGHQRAEWKCVCGSIQYTDFENSKPRAVQRLIQELRRMQTVEDAADSELTPAHVSAVPGPWSRPTSSSSSVTVTASAPAHQVCGGHQTTGTARSDRSAFKANPGPRQGQPLVDNSLSNPQLSRQVRRPTPTFIELCINTGKRRIYLAEIRVNDSFTDGMLFGEIWREYDHFRSRSDWTSRLRWVFKKPVDIHWVHFGLPSTQPELVSIFNGPNCIPPEQEVREKRYEYQECPMDPLPPMKFNNFYHYLDQACRDAKNTNPRHLHHRYSTWFKRFPKRVGSVHDTSEPATFVSGWGVYIVEGVRKTAVLCMLLFLFVIGISVGLVYAAAYKTSEQGWGISAVLTSFLFAIVGSVYTYWDEEYF